MRFVQSSWAIFAREWVRFFRQPSRVIGALLPPFVFWFILGSGLGSSFQMPGTAASINGVTALQYFFPGTIALIVLFTAIFSTISVIDDRHQGFLQSVLVSPASRASVVFGKVMGGTALALIEAVLFLLIIPFVPLSISFSGVVYLIVNLALMAFALTSLGLALAWRFDSVQGFHAVMNLILMPMWFLSGALFPMSGAPQWLQYVMRLNPLTYGVSALRYSLLPPEALAQTFFFSPATCCGILAICATLFFLLSYAQLRK